METESPILSDAGISLNPTLLTTHSCTQFNDGRTDAVVMHLRSLNSLFLSFFFSFHFASQTQSLEAKMQLD